MYYVTFRTSDTDLYTQHVQAKSALHAIRLVCRGCKRILVAVTLTPPTTLADVGRAE